MRFTSIILINIKGFQSKLLCKYCLLFLVINLMDSKDMKFYRKFTGNVMFVVTSICVGYYVLPFFNLLHFLLVSCSYCL